eukprot:8949621-Pyramimonas_sp.AAC.1
MAPDAAVSGIMHLSRFCVRIYRSMMRRINWSLGSNGSDEQPARQRRPLQNYTSMTGPLRHVSASGVGYRKYAELLNESGYGNYFNGLHNWIQRMMLSAGLAGP